uniref:Uncharacterized protein n=1 Tax=Cuerna arida TaxID=1464854 RepID=A0A1B6ESR3_9HEMI
MEMVSERRAKPAYYFSGADQEILDDRTLALSCDEDTWLYKIEVGKCNGQFQTFQQDAQFQNQQTQSSSGSVDTRTFTRRKRCSLRPSLESVVESPLSNRSSLGVLDANKMLNDTLQMHFTQTPTSESQEKISSNFTASDKKSLPPRVFKLDSPFMNSSLLEGAPKHLNLNFERTRIDSESSDYSAPNSLENFSSFDKNGIMTDSLVNFLEKQEVSCCPPTAFRDENPMTNSLVSLPENCDPHNVLGANEQMTDSMLNFLAPVNCKPPSGFEDNDMTTSVVSIDKAEDALPRSDLTNPVMDYLENVKSNKSNPLPQNIASSETENIPPGNCDIKMELNSQCAGKLKPSGDTRVVESNKSSKLNSTYDLDRNGEVPFNSSNENDEMANINFTNTVNITHKKRENGEIEDNLNITRSLNSNFDKELSMMKENNERSLKAKALNNRDLNVTRDLKVEEITDLNSKNGSKQLPVRNSTFNTTFTKLQSQAPSNNSTFNIHSQGHRGLNSTFTKSSEVLNGGVEDDQTSSASDSSFSSGSTKPRSVDELRTIAQQQESNLVQQTSTPIDSNATSSNFAKLDIELSPIRRLSMRSSESRSANCSPVRSPHPRAPQHPISKLQQPTVEARRQQLQASSLSNIARPKVSGLRMPQPVSVFTAPQRSGVRPATAIPRPQLSRLPMPSFRRSGIPGPKQNNQH